MKKTLLKFTLFFVLFFPIFLQSQIPKAISYEGVLLKDGKAYHGNATFVFTLLKGNTVVWTSLPKEIQVTNGLFGTILGPFHDTLSFFGIDSLGITYDGIELSPKAAFTAVAYSLNAFHALIADSTTKPGPKGDKGDLGAAGVKGENGLDGASGAQGIAGANGLQGNQGLKGDTGLDGSAGVQGLKGDNGSQGVQGLKGDIGLDGSTGSQGLQGNQGLKGDTGLDGSAGVQGLKGDNGSSGAQGLKGDTGLNGASGAQGIAGANGLQGNQGLKGDTGLDGAAGVQGIQGNKGDSGVIGSQGLQGDAGLQGIQGSKGDRGDSGVLGNQGEKGIKGDNGTNPISLTATTQSANIFTLNDVALVRSGDASTLRLENATSPMIDATYSAFWHTTSAVGTGNGMVAGGSQVVFDVHLAYQFSIMVKVGEQWGKIDLFRVDLAATDWYGSWTSN